MAAVNYNTTASREKCESYNLELTVSIQAADNKEVDTEACKQFLSLIKKLIKSKENAKESAEVTKKPRAKNFEEHLEKYLEQKFPWWPSKLIEDLGVVTEEPTTKPTPLDTLVTSYMDLFKNLLEFFKI